MFLNIIQISPEDLEKVKDNPELLETVVFEGKNIDELTINYESDVDGVDYLNMVNVWEALAEANGENSEDYYESKSVQEDALYKVLDSEEGKTTIEEIDFGYDPAQYIDPKSVQKFSEYLKKELDLTEQELNDEADRDDILISTIFEKAAQNNKGIILAVN